MTAHTDRIGTPLAPPLASCSSPLSPSRRIFMFQLPCFLSHPRLLAPLIFFTHFAAYCQPLFENSSRPQLS